MGVYCITRTAMKPGVVWSGRNDEPWNRVKQGTNYNFPAFSAGVPDADASGQDVDLRGQL
jgi:hypothetical protein